MKPKVCRGKMEKERETIRTRTENEDGEHYRSRRGAVVLRAGWGIEQVEERKEGVRALRGARAARAGERKRERAIGSATRTVATVRHEREQGDERVSESARRRSL